MASAQLSVRRLGETAWTPLTTTRQDDAFTAVWPAGGQPGYHALRVEAEDLSQNRLDYQVDPAFRVGSAAGNHAPEATTLLTPGTGYEIDLDTLSAPVSFSWRPAADPDAGQEVRYLLHLAGPGLDTTLATAATTLAADLTHRLQHGATYTWTVEATDGFALVAAGTAHTFTTVPFGVPIQAGGGLPDAFALEPGYPNPFNPATHLRFALPHAANVRLEVFDALGRRVAVLAEGPLPAGYHTRTWEAAGLSSGLYLIRLRAAGYQQTRTVTLLK